jgi:hypothetical protein
LSTNAINEKQKIEERPRAPLGGAEMGAREGKREVGAVRIRSIRTHGIVEMCTARQNLAQKPRGQEQQQTRNKYMQNLLFISALEGEIPAFEDNKGAASGKG